MKKAYTSPKAIVVTIKVQQMMTASPAGTDVLGNASSSYETLSREDSFWDDEEEDF